MQDLDNPTSLRGYSFQRGLQQGIIAEPVNDNTVRVIATDTGAVTLGQCADNLGNTRSQICTDTITTDTTVRADDKETYRSVRAGEPLFSKLNKAIFGQYTISSSADVSIELKAYAKGLLTRERHQVVYEWSRYVTIGLELRNGEISREPQVTSIDYGFALRMILDVRIQNTEATAALGLGPAQLEAALALGVAEVSVRYQALGVTASFLPKSIDQIKDAASLRARLGEFHKQALALKTKWESHCAGGSSDEAGCPVEIVPLAFYVTGQGVGRNFARERAQRQQCDTLQATEAALIAEKTAAPDGKLSDKKWNRLGEIQRLLDTGCIDSGQETPESPLEPATDSNAGSPATTP